MPDKILIAVDLADVGSASTLIETAERLGGPDGAELHALAVVPTYSMPIVGSFFPGDFEQKATEKARAVLAETVAVAASAPSKVTAHVAHGTIYHEILRLADELACDLIVIKAGRPRPDDYLLGSNAARVVRHAKQSVHVYRD